MKIGITCYPTYGGSGVVATELGIELAARGHFAAARVQMDHGTRFAARRCGVGAIVFGCAESRAIRGDSHLIGRQFPGFMVQNEFEAVDQQRLEHERELLFGSAFGRLCDDVVPIFEDPGGTSHLIR